jgi:hypothetical protein
MPNSSEGHDMPEGSEKPVESGKLGGFEAAVKEIIDGITSSINLISSIANQCKVAVDNSYAIIDDALSQVRLNVVSSPS